MDSIGNDKIDVLNQHEMGYEKKEEQPSPLAIAIQNDGILGNVIQFLNVFI